MRYSRIHDYMLDELAVGSYQSAVKKPFNCKLPTDNCQLSFKPERAQTPA